MTREDLGSLLGRGTQRMIEAERPLLAKHGLSMWAYIALSHLSQQPAETQLALAQGIGYDKTRLIGLLDELEGSGLITRTPGLSDRRAHIVQLTKKGSKLHAAVQKDIHAMEDELLRDVDVTDRERLRTLLARIAREPVS